MGKVLGSSQNHAKIIVGTFVEKIRLELYDSHTSGLAANKLQANVVILPSEYANDFYMAEGIYLICASGSC